MSWRVFAPAVVVVLMLAPVAARASTLGDIELASAATITKGDLGVGWKANGSTSSEPGSACEALVSETGLRWSAFRSQALACASSPDYSLSPTVHVQSLAVVARSVSSAQRMVGAVPLDVVARSAERRLASGLGGATAHAAVSQTPVKAGGLDVRGIRLTLRATGHLPKSKGGALLSYTVHVDFDFAQSGRTFLALVASEQTGAQLTPLLERLAKRAIGETTPNVRSNTFGQTTRAEALAFKRAFTKIFNSPMVGRFTFVTKATHVIVGELTAHGGKGTPRAINAALSAETELSAFARRVRDMPAGSPELASLRDAYGHFLDVGANAFRTYVQALRGNRDDLIQRGNTQLDQFERLLVTTSEHIYSLGSRVGVQF